MFGLMLCILINKWVDTYVAITPALRGRYNVYGGVTVKKIVHNLEHSL